MVRVYIGSQHNKQLFIILLILFFLSCSTKMHLENKTPVVSNIDAIDTLYTNSDWYKANYTIKKNGGDNIITKSINLPKDYTLKLIWQEEEDDIIGNNYSNSTIEINKYVYNIDDLYFDKYKAKISEGMSFVAKNIIIYKKADTYTMNLIMFDNLCAIDCYTYEIIEIDIFDDKRKPEIQIYKIESSKGIPIL